MGYFSKQTKKDVGKRSKSYASSYWYDTYEKGWDYLDKSWYSPKQITSYKETQNIYKLASVRRAITNFVQIVTGKNIPVTYATKSASQTDGKSVILSADVDDNFDVSVGLALHEGSHIILSNFDMLHEVNKIAEWYFRSTTKWDAVDAANNGPHKAIIADMFSPTGKINTIIKIDKNLYTMIMGLSNWIEDRRIDNYIYNSAPGYRDYYIAMYDYYFNDPIVTKGIASDEYTDETIDSYWFRIINLLNDKTDLSKLKGLRDVHSMLNLKNINRITSSTQSLELSIDIMCKILSHTKLYDTNGQTSTKSFSPADAETDEDVSDEDVSDVEVVESDSASGGKTLSPKVLAQLKKKIAKQNDFLNNTIKRKTVSKEDVQKLNEIDESGSEVVKVGTGVVSASSRYSTSKFTGKGVDCIVVKRLTESMLNDSQFVFTSTAGGVAREKYAEHVDRGLMLGTILGKKLQARSETRETIFSRLKKGRIDKRMIASLGYDNDSVFYTNDVDQYKKVNLHISLDYSGSMSGKKLNRTIIVTMAIAKAAMMARNINVQISIRSVSGGLPWICQIYDSRVNTIKTLAKYMGRLCATNTTPEGLCFEAIQKYLIPSSNDTDSYFLNISDGGPSFSIANKADDIEYSGEAAASHTYKQVKRMQEAGINVLSYFLTENASDAFEHSDDWRIFRLSYGSAAKYVNVEDMMQVSKTLNELFLKK